jgi:hypothetical protein
VTCCTHPKVGAGPRRGLQESSGFIATCTTWTRSGHAAMQPSGLALQRGLRKWVHTDTVGVLWSFLTPSSRCEPGFPFAAVHVLVLFSNPSKSSGHYTYHPL